MYITVKCVKSQNYQSLFTGWFWWTSTLLPRLPILEFYWYLLISITFDQSKIRKLPNFNVKV